MKLFIAGSGTLGSASAFLLASKDLADEIVIYDTFQPLAEHHAMDIDQAVCVTSGTRVRAAADWSGIQDSDIVIVAVGLPADKAGRDQANNIAQFVPMIRELCSVVKKLAPEAIVITLSNPVDVINYLMYKVGGLSPKKVMGYSLNDTIRMRWAIANYYDVPAEAVSAVVGGTHGNDRVQLFSTTHIDGEKKQLSEEALAELGGEQTKWWKRFIGTGIKRTAGWTTAAGVAIMVETILGIRTDPLPCSCILEGENGFSNISMGAIARLGRSGIEEIIPFSGLTEEEQQQITNAAANVEKKIQQALSLI